MSIYSLAGVTPKFIDRQSCFIADSADIIGDVHIGRQSSVWFGAILRGDTETLTIGDQTNIQDGSILHADYGYPTSLGVGVTVGHKAIIHGCTINDNSLVGMGATILNGAVIGENCLVGAGALVGEGKVIEAGSLVIGMPGKTRRSLSDEEIKGLTKSAEHYMQNAQRYIQNLKIEVV